MEFEEKLNLAINEASENLQSTIMKLISNEPFFAAMLLNMTRKFETKIPTIGVNVTETVNLFVNPFFWNNLLIDERVEILKHEVYHVLNNHISRYKDLEPNLFDNKEKKLKEIVKDMSTASTLNQAADYAINEYLPNLPKTFTLFDENGDKLVEPEEILDENGNEIKNPTAGKTIEAYPLLVSELKKSNPDVLHRQTMEYYYDVLQKNKKNDGGNQSGDQKGTVTIDDHSLWSEGNTDSEYITEKIKQTVEKALEQVGQEASSIPSDVSVLIKKLNYKAKDWKSDLQKFISKATEILLISSRKIRNRRYGVIYPGIKIEPKLHIACCVDTSGSMSDEILNQIAVELSRISKNNVELTIIEADSIIQNVWKFDEKKLKQFRGRGGTAYGPALEYAEKELDVDGIIYFGDCDTSDIPKKPKIPVLWAITESYAGKFQDPPVNWGMKTNVKLNKKS